MSFLEAFAAASGQDPNLTDPNLVAGNVELGLFDQSDPEWQQNHGAPRDPQPGNNPKGNFDNMVSPENDTLQKPLQTAAGSTPTGHPPLHSPRAAAAAAVRRRSTSRRTSIPSNRCT